MHRIQDLVQIGRGAMHVDQARQYLSASAVAFHRIHSGHLIERVQLFVQLVKTLAALGPSALQDGLAVPGAHPLAKAVRPLATLVVWLVGTLHRSAPSCQVP